MINILIVGEKKPQLQEIGTAMREIGYGCSFADDYSSAMDKLLTVHVDLILADFASGACELCRDLRDTGNAVPFLTSRLSSPTISPPLGLKVIVHSSGKASALIVISLSNSLMVITPVVML